jgi:hypothetical protein
VRGVLVAVLVACALFSTSSSATAGDPNAEAVRAVNVFNPNKEQTFERLDAVIARGHVQLRVLKPQLRSGNIWRRWAATYIAHNLASKSRDYALLQPLLKDRNETVRTMAAVGLLAGGKKDAIPVLIDLMSSRYLLLFWEPPLPTAVRAELELERFTGARFPFDSATPDAERAAAVSAWHRWWKAVKTTIRWNPRVHRYRWRASTSFLRRAASPPPARHAVIPAATFSPAFPEARVAAQGSPIVADANTGTVTVYLQIDDVKDFGAIANALKGGENFLNGSGQTGKCNPIKFKLDARAKGSSFPAGVTPIETKTPAGQTHGTQRSWTNPGARQARWYYGDLTSWYGAGLVAHEVSHALGLDDEYQNAGTGSNEHSVPLDDESYMSDDGCCQNTQQQAGRVEQRHLDRLAELLFGQKNSVCKKYTLSFAPWQATLDPYPEPQGSGVIYYIGRSTTANVFADFWVNPSSGAVSPAGDKVCTNASTNQLNPDTLKITKSQFDQCRKDDFPGGKGGNSTIVSTSVNTGTPKCTGTFKATRKDFYTSVTGAKTGGQFQLNLNVGDQEVAKYACKAPARSGPGGTKQDVHDSMHDAGALSFQIQAITTVGQCASRPFTLTVSHGSAAGTVKVCPLP